MDPLKIAGTPKVELTADQKQALQRLHEAAQQFEGVFIGMLFKEMHKSDSQTSLTGKKSQGEKIFGEMLDDERAKSLSSTGALGIGKILEQQLRSAVLGNAAREAKTRVDEGNR